MAVNVKFDLVGNPEPPTIILAKRNGDKLGQLDVNANSVELSDKFNDASEMSFTLNKYVDGKLTPLWDKVVDFKLVWCKEWNLWFEIKVELDEATETVKTIFCTQLGQAELSQINLYDVHINEEGDPNWNTENKEYKSTILYDPKNTDASLLHRLLKDKAPHYSVLHVDDTIKNIQRSFSFDDKSIHDAFQEIAEEIGCLFVYNSNSDENGRIQRTISVYDLWQNCLNPNCKHRGEFTDKCPKCGGIDIKQGYGEDTLIFVTSDELATKGIQLTSDTDEVKNCFKLEAGDDLMTATVRNCNPNGTDYIWHFSESTKEDMSDELIDRINSYDDLYKEYYSVYEPKLDESLTSEYNDVLVEKYKGYYNTESTCLGCGNEEIFIGDCPKCGSKNVLSGRYLQSIPDVVKGYSALMNAYYNVIDLALYLESGLMPAVKMSDTTAKEQAALLTPSSLSAVAVNTEYAQSISLATADSAVLSMAKIIVKSTYKVEVKTSTLSSDKVWEGNFVITNYSDENDTAESQTIKVTVNNDNETFIKQKIEKALNKEDTDDYSISGLFKKEHSDFCDELKKYALNPLKSFYDACDSCLNILIDQGAGNKNDNPDLYEGLYKPYYKKSTAITKEIQLREDELAVVKGVWNESSNEYSPKGLQQIIEECRNKIQQALNFENYLGKDLWLEFCSYRRDDTYTNDNYISDGLDNAKLFERALEFYESAENEIYKSAELQHSISTTLNNLLKIDKFKPLIKSFKTGNWIRVRVDDRVFKLRLLKYDINFNNFENIPVEFSDVTKIKNGITDVKSVFEQASSMATNYSSVQRQAKQGEKSHNTLSNWVENGLNTTQAKIVDSVDENLLFGKNSFWCRQYDPITKTYSDEQIKIINSTIAITDDNWNTTKTAIGKFYYIDPITKEEKIAYGVNGEAIVGKLLIGENLIISNSNNKLVFDDNGFAVSGKGESIVRIQPSEAESIFNIKNNNGDYVLYLDNDTGDLLIKGNIISTKLEVENDDGTTSSLSNVAISGRYEDLIDEPTKLSDFTNDANFITKDVNDLSNYYNKSAIDNSLNSLVNEAVNDALEQAKANGEFNGMDGMSATHSWEGTILTISSASGTSSADLKGDKGDSPIRGTDYWTDSDKSEIVNAVIAELRNQGLIG